jgi:tRNA(Met) cytidine acetyltransferase
LQPLSAAGGKLFDRAHSRFHRHLPDMLGDALRDLEPELAALLLLRDHTPPAPNLDRQDWRDVCTFAFALRQYELCPGPIRELARFALAQTGLGATERALLISRVLQGRSWKEVADQLELSGRKAALAELRKLLGRMVLRYGDETVLRNVETEYSPVNEKQ